MKRILSAVAVLIAVVALSVPAYAGEGKGKGKRGKARRHAGKIFKHFDKNKDGSLTADEVPEKIWNKISRADANGDGAVTKAELRQARKDRRGKRKDKAPKSDG